MRCFICQRDLHHAMAGKVLNGQAVLVLDDYRFIDALTGEPAFVEASVTAEMIERGDALNSCTALVVDHKDVAPGDYTEVSVVELEAPVSKNEEIPAQETPKIQETPPVEETAPVVPPVEETAPTEETAPVVPPTEETAPVVPPVEETAPVVPPVEETAPVVPPVEETAPAPEAPKSPKGHGSRLQKPA